MLLLKCSWLTRCIAKCLSYICCFFIFPSCKPSSVLHSLRVTFECWRKETTIKKWRQAGALPTSASVKESVCVCMCYPLPNFSSYLFAKQMPKRKDFHEYTHDYRVKTCALVAIQDYKLHIVNFYRACKLSYITVNATFHFSIAPRKRSKQNTDNSKLSRNIWSKKHVIMYRSYCNAIRGNSYTGLQLCNFLTGVYWGIIFWRK